MSLKNILILALSMIIGIIIGYYHCEQVYKDKFIRLYTMMSNQNQMLREYDEINRGLSKQYSILISRWFLYIGERR